MINDKPQSDINTLLYAVPYPLLIEPHGLAGFGCGWVVRPGSWCGVSYGAIPKQLFKTIPPITNTNIGATT